MDNQEKQRLLDQGYTIEEVEYMEESMWLEETYFKPIRETEKDLRNW